MFRDSAKKPHFEYLNSDAFHFVSTRSFFWGEECMGSEIPISGFCGKEWISALRNWFAKS
jgi:hypothetical protein